jgi:hypothetical protein
MIHQRPAVLQDLEWKPSAWAPGSMSVSTDPVEKFVFSFYNDRLYRVVVDYGYDRTEGMTDADMRRRHDRGDRRGLRSAGQASTGRSSHITGRNRIGLAGGPVG